MAARISTRISIKWAAEPASEPTDTLVLSLGGYYVDLRIAKINDTIDWALAGQRIVVSEQPHKVKFTYSINSQDDTAGEVQPENDTDDLAGDVGLFSKLPNGDDFETGEMAAPHLGGEITPYEEVWRQLHPSMDAKDPFCSASKAWILESVDDNGAGSHHGNECSNPPHKTFLARIGPFFIAIRRRGVIDDSSGKPVTTLIYGAIRQKYDATSSLWVTKYSAGDDSNIWTMSSGSAFRTKPLETGTLLQVNDAFELGGTDAMESYVVRAISY